MMGAGLSEGDRSDTAATGMAGEAGGGRPGRTARMAAGGPVVPPRPALPGAAPRFSQPVRQIVLMLVVLLLVGGGAWFAYGRILPVFAANPLLNGAILVVFALGVLTCFWQVAQLVNSASWIERFAAATSAAARRAAEAGATQEARPADLPGPAPRLLAPLAALLGAGRPGAVGPISTEAARSILESVAARIDEGRDITRYLGNLLIFLGLLGTFYGLATTVPAIVETIRTLSPQQGESGVEVFDKLMHGLEMQLGGMATAFSSSLLGLAGSLVVGLLDLFASHGQNRFYRELEEWVSGFTRLAPAGGEGGAGGGVDRALLGAFLGDLDARIGALQDWYARRDRLRDDEAAQADARSVALAGAVERVLAGLEADRAALGAALERQAGEAAAVHERLAGVLERLAGAAAGLAEGQARLEAGQAGLVRAQGQLAEGLGQLAEAGARPVELAPDLAEALDEALAQLAEGQRRLIALAEAPPPVSVAMPDALSHALVRITESQQRLALLLQPPGAAPGRPAAPAAEPEGEAAQRSALQRLLRRLTEGQARLVELVEARAPGQDDPEVRMRLRSIDVQLGRLVEESASARDGLISELRADLAALTRAIRGLEGRDGA